MILVIGYGNPLRADDAIGQKVAQIMAERLYGKDVRVEIVFQLTPELVEVVSQSQFAIFIDAGIEGTPGAVEQKILRPEAATGAFTHNVTPETLLSAAKTLYGAEVCGLLISIAGASLDYSTELSPQLAAIQPDLADRVEEIIRDILEGIVA